MKTYYDHTLKNGQKITGKFKLEKHLEDCKKHECVRHEFPAFPYNYLKFKNIKNQQKHPVTIVADFESTLEKISTEKGKSTEQYQKHIPNSFCYYIMYNPNLFPNEENKLVMLTQDNANQSIAKTFCELLESDITEIYNKYWKNAKPLPVLTDKIGRAHV